VKKSRWEWSPDGERAVNGQLKTKTGQKVEGMAVFSSLAPWAIIGGAVAKNDLFDFGFTRVTGLALTVVDIELLFEIAGAAVLA